MLYYREGLYRGWFPVVSTLCCSNFVYFYVYNCLKVISHDEGADAHAVKDLTLAFIAGQSSKYQFVQMLYFVF